MFLLGLSIPVTGWITKPVGYYVAIAAGVLFIIGIGVVVYGYKLGKDECKQIIENIPEILSSLKARRIQVAQETSSKMPDVLDVENTEPTWIDVTMNYWALHTGKTKGQLTNECLSDNNFTNRLKDEIVNGVKKVNENILKEGKASSDEDINIFTEKDLSLETKVNNDKQYIKLRNKLDKAKRQPKITLGLMGAINDYLESIVTYTSYFVMTTQYLSMADMLENLAPEKLKPTIAKNTMPARKWRKTADRQLDDKLAKVSEEISKIQW